MKVIIDALNDSQKYLNFNLMQMPEGKNLNKSHKALNIVKNVVPSVLITVGIMAVSIFVYPSIPLFWCSPLVGTGLTLGVNSVISAIKNKSQKSSKSKKGLAIFLKDSNDILKKATDTLKAIDANTLKTSTSITDSIKNAKNQTLPTTDEEIKKIIEDKNNNHAKINNQLKDIQSSVNVLYNYNQELKKVISREEKKLGKMPEEIKEDYIKYLDRVKTVSRFMELNSTVHNYKPDSQVKNIQNEIHDSYLASSELQNKFEQLNGFLGRSFWLADALEELKFMNKIYLDTEKTCNENLFNIKIQDTTKIIKPLAVQKDTKTEKNIVDGVDDSQLEIK